MMKIKNDTCPLCMIQCSSSFNGKRNTTINGEGKNPCLEDILAVAKNIGIKEK